MRSWRDSEPCNLQPGRQAGTKPGYGVQTRQPPFHTIEPLEHFSSRPVALGGQDQKMRSEWVRFPAAPTPARVKLKLYWFSFRTEPRARRRYSTTKPQQSRL